jgi:sialate O-acetylesterase
VLKAGESVITVRLLDTGGTGGIDGTPNQLKLEFPNTGIESISVAGSWKYKETTSITKVTSTPPSLVIGPHDLTVLYNGMITPLIKFPIKGVIWYQGESNNDRAKQYQTLFPTLIDCWRNVWNEPNLPFLYVQIAPYRDMTPEIREAQFLTLFDTHDTAMAVITDAGVADDIHPGNKQIVGARLALAALAKAYGRKIEYSGPLYKSYKIRGNHIEISFTHTGKGLVAKGGELKGFTIAGADKKFLPAQAQIVGDKVSVWNDSVDSPVAVRYGWANVPDVNLYNVEGLPASPFRTDVDK